ncbi:caspase family protein [Fulvivirgaceae bacterium BMA12]|uniref:Caspase family protein n=1 Tax=Agaribacillus aureus TaxID=3051825 RepID=A0ABT8LBV3_9BACT|nr:caspase family protein [Fulvivirgaceae bacterium BMA12]
MRYSILHFTLNIIKTCTGIFFILILNQYSLKAQNHENSNDTISVNKNCPSINNKEKQALLIAVGKPHSYFKKELKGPVNEIKHLVELLDNNGYAVYTLTDEDATKKNIEKKICQILSSKNLSQLLFYYAGYSISKSDLWDQFSKDLREKFYEKNEAEYILIPYQKDQDSKINEVICMGELNVLFNENKKEAHNEDKKNNVRKVIIIEATHERNFANVSPLVSNFFADKLPSDGLYALTSLKDTTYDGEYGPVIIEALEGKADKLNSGNNDGIVSIWELTSYFDNHINVRFGDMRGENFSSRYIFIGNGNVPLTNVLSNK